MDWRVIFTTNNHILVDVFYRRVTLMIWIKLADVVTCKRAVLQLLFPDEG